MNPTLPKMIGAPIKKRTAAPPDGDTAVLRAV